MSGRFALVLTLLVAVDGCGESHGRGGSSTAHGGKPGASAGKGPVAGLAGLASAGRGVEGGTAGAAAEGGNAGEPIEEGGASSHAAGKGGAGGNAQGGQPEAGGRNAAAGEAGDDAGGAGDGGGGAGAGGEDGGPARCGATVTYESCNGIDDDCDGKADDLGQFSCGMGACRVTVTACVEGAIQACVPKAPTPGPDACDGVDSDCDGAVDEDCAACVRVAPNGDDTAAAADGGTTPFLHVQAAIDYAATHSEAPPRVCVASGASCGAAATFAGPTGADLEMADGIELLGGYESTGWTRCSNSTTTLAPGSARGVVFPADITHTTILDGFTITTAAYSLAAAVTVDGARGAVLANLVIPRSGTLLTKASGVELKNGADGTIFRCRIESAYAGTTAAVRATGARVDIVDNCPCFDAQGRCSLDGCSEPIDAGIFAGAPQFGTLSDGIVLEDAPGSRVERNAVSGDLGLSAGALLRVNGAAAGVVIRGNHIDAAADLMSSTYAVALETCEDDSPWVVDNAAITLRLEDGSYDNGYPSATVRAAGGCHPVIEANQLIEGSAGRARLIVVDCDFQPPGSSRCVISNNPAIRATELTGLTEFGPYRNVIGIACGGEGCARIDHNDVRGYLSSCTAASCARISTALIFRVSGSAWVASNVLIGSRGGSIDGVGVDALTGAGGSRFENNVIIGALGVPMALDATAPAGGQPTSAVGFLGYADVSSNLLAGSVGAETGAVNCASRGLELVTGGGSFRNNVIRGGACGPAIYRAQSFYAPEVFASNAVNSGAPNGASSYTTATGVVLFSRGSTLAASTLVDAAAELDADPDFHGTNSLDTACPLTGNYQLPSGSACIDRGTTDAAPYDDRDGDRRDALADIGPDERR